MKTHTLYYIYYYCFCQIDKEYWILEENVLYCLCDRLARSNTEMGSDLMISKKKFNYINELQDVQRLAVACPCDVAFHSLDSSIFIDAKSYIGMYALNFNEPVLVVCEDEDFHKKIKDIGENVE